MAGLLAKLFGKRPTRLDIAQGVLIHLDELRRELAIDDHPELHRIAAAKIVRSDAACAICWMLGDEILGDKVIIAPPQVIEDAMTILSGKELENPNEHV